MGSWQKFLEGRSFYEESREIMEFLSWLIWMGKVTGAKDGFILCALTYEELEALYKVQPWKALSE